MKTILICASSHHGNTMKLAQAIKDKHEEVTLVNLLSDSCPDLNEYELIGFISGIYAGKYHKKVLNAAKDNLPQGKKVFTMNTSASGTSYCKSLMKALEGKNADFLGEYFCQGFNTFGPFKLVGGTAKGHPTSDEIQGAVTFFEGLK